MFTCVVTWGGVLWTIHLAFKKFAGGKNVKLNGALLYSWGSLLEQSMKNPFNNVPTKVLLSSLDCPTHKNDSFLDKTYKTILGGFPKLPLVTDEEDSEENEVWTYVQQSLGAARGRAG